MNPIDDQTPVNLAPLITPELLEENEKNQKEWQKFIKIPDFLLSGQAAWQKRDAILTRDLSQTIAFLEGELEKITAEPARSEIITVLIKKRDELSEIYARKGEFGLAAVIASSEARARLYTSYFEAEERADKETCPHFGKNNYLEKYPIKSKKYGDFAALLRCNVCGFRNLKKISRAELDRLNYGNHA